MNNNPIVTQQSYLNSQLPHIDNLYHRMIDEVQDYAIILLDIDGFIREWNKGAQKIKQYSKEEALGKHFSIFYPAEDRKNGLPEQLFSEAIERGRVMHEGWRLKKDQSRFWGSVTLTALHDEKGNVFGVSKVTRDLTEMRESTEALRSSEERYYKMIAEVEDYAIILLDKNGNIQNWNAGAQKIKGYQANEIVGKHFRLFYLPEDRDNKVPEKLMKQAELTGKALHEGWRMRKDGTVFWGSIVITALHGSDGSVIGFSKVTRDLTERKNAEDQLRHYLVELEARNTELEQFTYIASHDLQEPLRKIQTFSDIISANMGNEAILKKYFTKINESSQRMSELIKSVLNYSKLSRINEMHATDLSVVLKTVLEDLELTVAERGATVEVGELPVVIADRVQMSQLFFNLVSNAIKFSPQKPVINITCSVIESANMNVEVNYPTPKKFYQIAVSDRGIGFDQQYEHIIFNMFQRLHNRHEYSGTGIGLALCKKIVENHGGLITAKGELNKGATFYVYLPFPEN